MSDPISVEKMFSPQSLSNFEQREAIQREVNEQNRQISLLNDQCKKELEAVTAAIDILTKAGVVAYVFPFMAVNEEKKTTRLYHNIDHFMKWKNDKLDKNSIRLISQMNHSFIDNWFEFIKNGMMGGGEFSWDRFCRYLSNTLEENRKWMRDGIEFEGVVNYKERE